MNVQGRISSNNTEQRVESGRLACRTADCWALRDFRVQRVFGAKAAGLGDALSGIRVVFGFLFCKPKSVARPPSGEEGWMNCVECHLIPVAMTIANQDNQCLSKAAFGHDRVAVRQRHRATRRYQNTVRTHVDRSTGRLVRSLDLLQITHHHHFWSGT